MKRIGSLFLSMSLCASSVSFAADPNMNLSGLSNIDFTGVNQQLAAQNRGNSYSILLDSDTADFAAKITPNQVFEQFRTDVGIYGDDYLTGEFNKVAPTLLQGPGVSGGGNSVVCFDSNAIPAKIRDPKSGRFGQIGDDEIKNHVVSVIAYDLYFAQMPHGMDQSAPQLIEPGPNESARDYLERIARRFDNYMPAISALIRHGSTAFKDSNILSRPAGLDRIHDEKDVGYIDPSNCVVATMAAQYRMGNESILQLDNRLFNHPKHSKLSRYVLLLHEVIYNSVRTFTKQTDSASTRMLVGAILNQAPIKFDDLQALYDDLKLPVWPSLVNAPTALYYARADAIRYDMDMTLRGIWKSSENASLVNRYNALLKKYTRNPDSRYLRNYIDGSTGFAGAIKLVGDECSVQTKAIRDQCNTEFYRYERDLVPFQDRMKVALMKTYLASLKKNVLLPLSTIPDSNGAVISDLGLNLWAVFQDETNPELGSLVVPFDKPVMLMLDMKMFSRSIEGHLQKSKISEMIP